MKDNCVNFNNPFVQSTNTPVIKILHKKVLFSFANNITFNANCKVVFTAPKSGVIKSNTMKGSFDSKVLKPQSWKHN